MSSHQHPLSSYCQMQPLLPPTGSGGMCTYQSIRCFRCGEDKHSMDEIRAHIAWDHLNYAPYRCGLCGMVYRPTERTLMIHIEESHPDAQPQMLYAPDREKERVLQFDISQSIRVTAEGRYQDNQRALEAEFLSPTPSSESACSSSSGEGPEPPEPQGDPAPAENLALNSANAVATSQEGDLPSTSIQNRDVTPPPSTSAIVNFDLQRTPEKFEGCHVCKEPLTGLSKAQKHEHVLSHLRRDNLNINRHYAIIYTQCFPSPPRGGAPGASLSPKKGKLAPMNADLDDFLAKVDPQLALGSLKPKFSAFAVVRKIDYGAHTFPPDGAEGNRVPAPLPSRYRGARSLTVPLLDGQFELGATQVFCHLCRGTIEACSVFKHVIHAHLDENCVRCGLCGFETLYNLEIVREHSKTQHPGVKENIEDMNEKFGNRVKELLRFCFPDRSNAELLVTLQGRESSYADDSLDTRSYEDISDEEEETIHGVGPGPKTWKIKKKKRLIAGQLLYTDKLAEKSPHSFPKSVTTSVKYQVIVEPITPEKSPVHAPLAIAFPPVTAAEVIRFVGSEQRKRAENVDGESTAGTSSDRVPDPVDIIDFAPVIRRESATKCAEAVKIKEETKEISPSASTRRKSIRRKSKISEEEFSAEKSIGTETPRLAAPANSPAASSAVAEALPHGPVESFRKNTQQPAKTTAASNSGAAGLEAESNEAPSGELGEKSPIAKTGEYREEKEQISTVKKTGGSEDCASPRARIEQSAKGITH